MVGHATCTNASSRLQQRCLGGTVKVFRNRPCVFRLATSASQPTDATSGKIPDNTVVPVQPSASSESRHVNISPAAPSTAPVKRKGSWTPPYPSLVNNKPLPTEDVKTNIDM